MSGAQGQVTDDRADPPVSEEIDGVNPETERVARLNGWRPKAEFKGDPERWIPADVFVARGFEVPAILANRNKALTSKLDDMQRQFDEERRTMNQKLDTAVETVSHVTTMLRTAEQRSYDRARRELKTEMEEAVRNGDTATWQRLDQEREALENTKPAAPPAAPAKRADDPQPARRGGPTDPAVQRFFERNRWYDPERKRDDRDDEMMAYADTVHAGLLQTQPNATMEQNLSIVESEVRRRFPERTGSQRARDPNPDPDPDTRNNGSGGDRREESPAVLPSSGGTQQRRNANPYTFDKMPQASKDAYTRYARLLEGKGQPLTKDEWATDYWSQYRDDGSP